MFKLHDYVADAPEFFASSSISSSIAAVKIGKGPQAAAERFGV
jgi:hypothetical protein